MVVRRLWNLDNPIVDLGPGLITVEPVLCVKHPLTVVLLGNKSEGDQRPAPPR